MIPKLSLTKGGKEGRKEMFLVGYWWLTSIILAAWEAEIKRIKVLGQPRQSSLDSKITRAKWSGGMAQVIECLLCKCEALCYVPVSRVLAFTGQRTGS
jgi:hypothetical protein